MVVRPVEILRGVNEISKFLRCDKREVSRMAQEKSSPVVRDRNGIYRADKAEVWEWFKGRGVSEPA